MRFDSQEAEHFSIKIHVLSMYKIIKHLEVYLNTQVNYPFLQKKNLHIQAYEDYHLPI